MIQKGKVKPREEGGAQISVKEVRRAGGRRKETLLARSFMKTRYKVFQG